MIKTKQTLRIEDAIKLGPLDEKAAINGAGFVSNCVFTRVMNATGTLLHINMSQYLPITLEKFIEIAW